MLFMYISTHTPDYCMAGEPQVQMKVIEPVREGFQRAGVKVIGAYSCPPEHTAYYVLEAEDIVALHRALTPFIRVSTSRLVPVEKLDFMLS
jgi:hypothetical protein